MIVAIGADLNANNDSPRTFVWTATADEILVEARRGQASLQLIASYNRNTTLVGRWTMLRFGSLISALAVAGVAIGAVLFMATPAVAATTSGSGYSAGAQYQVELSSNVPGEGFWIWAELGANGSGNYQETDCLHLGGGHATDAAAHSAGDVSGWTVSGGTLTMSGVNIIGGLETVNISVPVPTSGYGSVSQMTVTFDAGVPIIGSGTPLTLPVNGEVAP